MNRMPRYLILVGLLILAPFAMCESTRVPMLAGPGLPTTAPVRPSFDALLTTARASVREAALGTEPDRYVGARETYLQLVNGWQLMTDDAPAVGRANASTALAEYGWLLYKTAEDEANRTEASRMLERAVRLDDRNALAHCKLGLLALYRYERSQDKQDLAAAEASLKRAIAADAKALDAYYVLGVVLAIRGDVDGAKNAYRRFLSDDGTHSMELYLYRESYLQSMQGAAQMVLKDLPGSRG